MMKAVLLYNPAAGRRREQRLQTLEQIVPVLRSRGFDARPIAATARGSAIDQSRAVVQAGAEIVFACGGDGTVHEVLQGLACTGGVLGIIPFGSANALAQELGIAANPIAAVSKLAPESFVDLRTTSIQRPGLPTRYSLCMAGVGADALLMYRMLTVDRARFGRWRYYENALRLFLLQRFTPFRAEVYLQDGSRSEHQAVCAMALRIGDLGGLFSRLARGATVHRGDLHLVLVRPPARITLPFWFVLSWLGLQHLHPGVSIANAEALRISDDVPLQVDGEWLGRTAVTIASDGPTQRVLVPESFSAGRASLLPHSTA